MAENKTNTGLLVASGFLLLAGGALLYFTNQKKKETQNENKAIEDIGSNPAAQQAAALYKYLGVTNAGGVYSAWAMTNDKYGIYNTCLEVTDIKALQDKFAQLCNNKYSLNDAMTSGTYDSEYKQAMQYLKAQKVVTTQDATPVTLRGTNGAEIIKFFPANTVLGALKSANGNKYELVNQATKNGEVTATVYATNARLVTP